MVGARAALRRPQQRCHRSHFPGVWCASAVRCADSAIICSTGRPKVRCGSKVQQGNRLPGRDVRGNEQSEK